MNDPTTIWERWPDAWRLVGLVLSSVILAIVLIMRGPAPTPTAIVPTATPVTPRTAAELSPISPPPTPAPGAPVIVAPQPGQIQAGAPIVLEGTAPPNTPVRVYDGSSILGETRSDEAGRWRLEVGQVWTEGPHDLRAVGLDANGNEVSSSPPIALVVPPPPEQTPPRVVVLTPTAKPGTPPAEATPTPSGAPARGEVNNVGLRMTVSIETPQAGATVAEDLPGVTGTAPAGALIRLYELQRLIGQAVASRGGAWEMDTTGQFPPGDHLIRAEAYSKEGVLLGVSPPIFFTIVSQATPSIETPTAGAVLEAPQPILSGTGEPGTHIRIYANSRPVAEATVNAQGRWKTRLRDPLSPGQYQLRAVVIDAKGKPVAESRPVPVTVPNRGSVLPLTGGEQPNPTPRARDER